MKPDPGVPTDTSGLGVHFNLIKNLMLLLGFFLVGLFLATFLATFTSGWLGEGTRQALTIQAILQSVFAFILPAWAVALVNSNKVKASFAYLGMNRGCSLTKIFWIILLFLAAMPAMNQIIHWNEMLTLPDSLSALEESWRRMEEENGKFTSILTSGVSIGALTVSVLVVGVLTGFAEELFFRGAFQGTLRRDGVSPHWAIWIAALIFSLLHFQMFGFVPRLLLGAWFGYLYYWSGSIWLSVIGHAFNNSLVVVCVWFSNLATSEVHPENLGVTEDGIPWMALLSTLIFSLLLIKGRKAIKNRNRNLSITTPALPTEENKEKE